MSDSDYQMHYNKIQWPTNSSQKYKNNLVARVKKWGDKKEKETELHFLFFLLINYQNTCFSLCWSN